MPRAALWAREEDIRRSDTGGRDCGYGGPTQLCMYVCVYAYTYIYMYRWGDISDRLLGHPDSVDSMLPLNDDVLISGSSDGCRNPHQRLRPHPPRLRLHPPRLRPHVPRLQPHVPRLRPHVPRLQPHLHRLPPHPPRLLPLRLQAGPRGGRAPEQGARVGGGARSGRRGPSRGGDGHGPFRRCPRLCVPRQYGAPWRVVSCE